MTSTTHYLVPVPSRDIPDLLSRVTISTGASEQIGKRLKHCVVAHGVANDATDVFSRYIHENGVGYYVSGQAKSGGVYLAAFFNTQAAAQVVEQTLMKLPKSFRAVSCGSVSISKHTKHIELKKLEPA